MKQLLFGLVALLLAASPTLAQKGKKKHHYLKNTYTPDEIRALENKGEKIAACFSGEFSNKAQADTAKSPLLKHQEIIAIPIWKKRVNEHWIYLSWCQAGNIQIPLVQFVYKIYKLDIETYAIERFNLPPSMHGLDWAKENPFESFKPADLVKTGCVHHIKAGETPHSFHIFLPEGAALCEPESPNRPYKFVALDVVLTPESLQMFNRFYGPDGNLLFTYPKPQGNLFMRMDKEQPKYYEELYGKKKKKD